MSPIRVVHIRINSIAPCALAGIESRARGYVPNMVDSDSEPGRDGQAPDEEAAARHAADVAAELSETETPHERRRIARAAGWVAHSAARTARRGAGTAGHSFASVVNWLTGQVLAMGPRLRIRDQSALRVQFPGRTDDEIAEELIQRAAHAAAAVGGATGAWAALPVLPAFPAEVATESLAVVGIEIKLVAELHEVYGMPAKGTSTERARAYIASWASRRGVYVVPGGLVLVAGAPLAGQVRRRLAARVRRSTFSLSPLFTGAIAGAMINSRETRRLGHQIRADLRRRLCRRRGQRLVPEPPPPASPTALP